MSRYHSPRYASFILTFFFVTLSSIPVQLHNALIVSLFDTSAHLAPPTPPPDLPKPPPRKRRRTLPYQGSDNSDPATLRSSRLKKWTVGMGRHERERIRVLESYASGIERRPQKAKDEIAAERGVQLLPERGGMLDCSSQRFVR